jgi:hypothetical protein
MATPSISSIRALLTQRLELLRALAESLEQAHAELATTTPQRLDRQSCWQRQLCWQLRTPASGFPGEADLQLANEVQGTAQHVAELNRKYAALLRRRRRTVDIFCRVLMNCGTTYPAPQFALPPGFGRGQAEGIKG